jgi:hypothetical protein
MQFNIEMVLWVDTNAVTSEEIKQEITKRLNTSTSEIQNISVHECKS